MHFAPAISVAAASPEGWALAAEAAPAKAAMELVSGMEPAKGVRVEEVDWESALAE